MRDHLGQLPIRRRLIRRRHRVSPLTGKHRGGIHPVHRRKVALGAEFVVIPRPPGVPSVTPGVTLRDIGVFGLYPPGPPEVCAFTPLIGGTGEDPVTGSLNASLAMLPPLTWPARAPCSAMPACVRVTADGDGSSWTGGGTRKLISGSVRL